MVAEVRETGARAPRDRHGPPGTGPLAHRADPIPRGTGMRMVNIRPRLLIPLRLPALLFALLLVGSVAAATPATTDAYTYTKVSSLTRAIRADRVVVSRQGAHRIPLPGDLLARRALQHVPVCACAHGIVPRPVEGARGRHREHAPRDRRLGQVPGDDFQARCLERRALDAAHVVRAGDAPDVHGQHEDRRPVRGGRRPGLLSLP
jgi:hypothetical protein